MIFEILTRNPPWPRVDKKEMIQLIIGGQRPELPEAMRRNAKCRRLRELMFACWNQDPLKRPNASEIVSMISEYNLQ